MNIKYLTLLQMFLLWIGALNAQVTIDFQVNQPPEPLIVDAGEDQNFDGTTPTILGGDPTATGAYGDYTYSWSPAQYLDDPTLANPTVTSLVFPTFFTVVVEADGALCAKEASTFVHYTVGLNSAEEVQLEVFPNPFDDQIRFSSELCIDGVRIHDVSGNVISNNHDKSMFEKGIIDTQELKAGVYFFTFEFNNGNRKTLKLCKLY